MDLTIVSTWIAAFLTLAILSFLYKDNPIYKFAEHLYVGVSAAYWMVYYYNNAIVPNLIDRLRYDHRWLYIIPGVLGLLIFARLAPRFSWVSRWALAFYIGMGVGVVIPATVQAYIVAQLQATLIPVWTGNIGTSIANILVVVGVLSVLVYFFFSREHKGALGGVARLGVYFLMISFGASFGYTVMARISLLIGRFQFLFYDWLHFRP